MSAPTSLSSPRSDPSFAELTDFDGGEELWAAWGDGLKPDPLLTISQWADAHRFLSPRASAEPGRYRTDRTPYMRAIMDALSPSHPARRVVFMKAAQVGATEAGNNWIGYVIHHAPGPMLCGAADGRTCQAVFAATHRAADRRMSRRFAIGSNRLAPAMLAIPCCRRSSRLGCSLSPAPTARSACARCLRAICSSTRSTPIRGRPTKKAIRLRSLKRERGRSAWRSKIFLVVDADHPRALADRAGIRGIRSAALLRPVPPLRAHAMASSSSGCGGTRGSRKPPLCLRGLRRAGSRSTTRRRCLHAGEWRATAEPR